MTKFIVEREDFPDIGPRYYNKLWLRVLMQAYEDLVKATYKVHNQKYPRVDTLMLYANIKNFFFGSESEEIGSLDWICSHIKYEKGTLKKAYLQKIAREQYSKAKKGYIKKFEPFTKTPKASTSYYSGYDPAFENRGGLYLSKGERL